MNPIVLTEFGETLLDMPDRRENPTRDEEELPSCLGFHAFCQGWLELNEASETHNSISCRQCRLRIVIPKSVDTFGKLREHFCQFNP